jgi:hypothetical protein
VVSDCSRVRAFNERESSKTVAGAFDVATMALVEMIMRPTAAFTDGFAGGGVSVASNVPRDWLHHVLHPIACGDCSGRERAGDVCLRMTMPTAVVQ